MKIRNKETVLKIDISFAATVTLMLILDDSGICATALFCCLVHEIGHIICLYLMGEKALFLRLSFYGIKLERRSGSFTPDDDLIVFAAGPAANLILSAFLLCFFKNNGGFYTTALLNISVALFNLIPCRPLDGGNMVYSVLRRFMREENADKICAVISACVLIPLCVFGIWLMLSKSNFTLIGVSFYLTAVSFFDKKEKDAFKL